MEDIALTGQWLGGEETSIDIAWQDTDDADGLRPEAIEIKVFPDDDPEHAYTANITAADGWRAVLNGEIRSIVPVWDKVNAEAEGGEDTEEGYRFEVSAAGAIEAQEDTIGEDQAPAGNGLVLTMIHTPKATAAIRGAITWNDYDNRDKKMMKG